MQGNTAGNIIELVGSTPLVRLETFSIGKSSVEILAKLEMFNPSGSVKDRISWGIINNAEKRGELTPGGTVVEATSGNTGIGLAMVCARRGYNLVLIMPETMSEERQKLLRAYGAELKLTPGDLGMKGAVDAAEKLLDENPDYFSLDQFKNPDNPEIHRQTTAKEILEQTGGNIDVFVAGIGTGGTITGTGEVLKQKIAGVKIYGIEPAGSAVLSGEEPGTHGLQGIGAGFVPDTLNLDVLDDVIKVTDKQAYSAAQELAQNEGILAGISSGAAVWAAQKVAKNSGTGKRIVTLLPDTGERYLSVNGLF